MNSKKLIQKQIDLYRSQFVKFGDSPNSTFNQTKEIQNLRFDKIIKNIHTNKKIGKILDVGCGICDLFDFLENEKFEFEYYGTDLVEEMKQHVDNKNKNINFKIEDILSLNQNEIYDFVVASGVFYLPNGVNKAEWQNFTRLMIKKMFFLSKKAISFNFISMNADFYNDKMYYESVEKIYSFCLKNLSRHIIIDHSYPLFEFTCTIFKPQYLKSNYSSNFSKYFKDN